MPDPTRKWRDRVDIGLDAYPVGDPTGCAFTDRCPYVMPVCHQQPPPLYPVGERQRASCFLYRQDAPDAPVGSSRRPSP